MFTHQARGSYANCAILIFRPQRDFLACVGVCAVYMCARMCDLRIWNSCVCLCVCVCVCVCARARVIVCACVRALCVYVYGYGMLFVPHRPHNRYAARTRPHELPYMVDVAQITHELPYIWSMWHKYGRYGRCGTNNMPYHTCHNSTQFCSWTVRNFALRPYAILLSDRCSYSFLLSNRCSYPRPTGPP